MFTISILGNENYEFPNKQDEPNLQEFLEKDVDIKTKPMCEKAFNKEYEQITTSDKDIYQCNVSSGYQDCKVGIKVSPTIRAGNNCTHILQRFEFPPKQELKLKLKDMLEDEVDEKYYLSEKMINFFYKNEQVQKEKGNGFRFGVSDGNVIAKAITTRAGSRMDDNFLKLPNKALRETLETNEIGNEEVQYIDSYNRKIKDDGLAKTITTRVNASNNDYLLIKEATKQGYKEAFNGDSVNLAYPDSKTRRGRVGEQVSQTLQTSDNMGVVVNG